MLKMEMEIPKAKEHFMNYIYHRSITVDIQICSNNGLISQCKIFASIIDAVPVCYHSYIQFLII